MSTTIFLFICKEGEKEMENWLEREECGKNK